MSQQPHFKAVSLVVVITLLLGLLQSSSVSAHPEVGQSINVAVIDSLYIINGGEFPTATTGTAGSFLDFHFYTLPVGSVSIAALKPGGICGASGCDTVVLNVASSGLSCNINNLSSQQKTDLVNFVGGGYKLIIYDSECPPQDYSWLPFSFTTANPGAMGAQGTLSIVEENTLSSNDPANVHYINAAMLGSQTDAVGDMNVMTTFDPNWFLDMAGTNILGVSGPVHTYAKYPSGTDYGLIIYNGLDVDAMYSGSVPDSSTPDGNLAKVWIHELQQPFNPSRLPGGLPVVGIALTPTSATHPTGQSHTVTATLTDLLAKPQAGIKVTFTVVSGPNAGKTGTCTVNADCTTDDNGQVSFSYVGTGGAGTDQIKGCFANQNNLPVCSQIVTADWTAQPLVYVALGDSYSSGEGIPHTYISGTDGPSNYCHRSTEAYSQVLSKDLGLQLNFFACSGAITDDITQTTRYGEDPQITHPEVTTAGLITMTIGGNDAGFADVLKACISQKLKADVIKAGIGGVVGPVVGPVAIWLGLGPDPSCANSQQFTTSLYDKLDKKVYPAVVKTYEALRGRNKNASIIVANYPHLFPDSSSEQGCLGLSPFLTKEDQTFLNTAADRLNSKLDEATRGAGLPLVNVRPYFNPDVNGHAICGNGGEWINGITIASGSQCTLSAFGKCLIPSYSISNSFHPNALGHADGYAVAFEDFINSPTDYASQVYLASPQALMDLAATTDAPAVDVSTLTTEPITPGTVDCEGTYQAGQQVLVGGDGFGPGGSVQLYVSSQGLGSVVEQQVGQFTADSSGHVAGTIRIPLNATGFTPSGAKAGLVFIDAIGLGPDGAHVDDVAMVGLAPHSSSCGTVEHLPFNGFYAPVANLPKINVVQPGSSIPVKFYLPGLVAKVNDVIATGYPQSASVSCTKPGLITTGKPTVAGNVTSTAVSDYYNYVWKTDKSWRGCRELVVKLVDGSYHQVVFNFGK
jgi:hypothetical protein